MKIYFDESGQTGCVLLKNKILNFLQQPIFAVGAVIVQNEEDEKVLLQKYRDFKTKFQIASEIKGSELMTRDRNAELEYLMKNIFDSKHFAVLLYDKRFYLATLLLIALMGKMFQDEEPILFYELAAQLSFEDDEFFVEYCQYIQSPSPERFHQYLLFLKDFTYKYVPFGKNPVKIMSEAVLENHDEDKFYDDFMTFGWYDNYEITNLINLNGLSELIAFIKMKNDVKNEDIEYCHDKIREFETTIKAELSEMGINMNFPHKDEPELLQLADNVTSVLCHTFSKMKKIFTNKMEWREESEWDLTLLSKLLTIIGEENISFTVPISDWAVALCVKKMFAPYYPKSQRKNLFFNPMYMAMQYEIAENILFFHNQADKISDLMKK